MHSSRPADRSLDFLLLGPFEVRAGSRLVSIGGQRQQRILAALLLETRQPVSIADLITAAWDDDPPETATSQIYNAISQLRRCLARHGAPEAMRSDQFGYRMIVDPAQVDVQRFDLAAMEGRRLAARGATVEAARVLRSALDLWRGPFLGGLAGGGVRQRAARLDEIRLSVLEDWAEIALATGERAGLIAELSAALATEPLRERLAASLMRALCRDGRQADALTVYQRVAAGLRENLGVDPGPELNSAFTAILHYEPLTLTREIPVHVSPVPLPVPAQLPADVVGFTGRSTELARLDDLLATIDQATSTAVVAMITGTAGVGKTTLAVQWARRVAHLFPDGQLYVDLRGFGSGGAAVEPATAVRGFLDAFAIAPHRVPADRDAQLGLFRSIVADKRVLILLDNARDAEQVRPLLPVAPGCLALITSRNWIHGLVAAQGAYPLTLDLLPVKDARDLLARRIGAHRVDAEPEAADQIIALCARLPLALVITAAQALIHERLSLTALCESLRAAGTNLDPFAGTDPATDVRTVFSWSYHALGDGAAALFRRLGLHPGPEIGLRAVASLMAAPPDAQRPLLAELTRAHLLVECAPGRYLLHDLLYMYASELAESTDTRADRHAAMSRVQDHYLHTAYAADRLLDPHRDRDSIELPADRSGGPPAEFADADAANAWFVTETPNLLAAVRQSADCGFDAHAWQLAWALATYLDRRGLWKQWIGMQPVALDAARRLGDRAAEARVHRSFARALARTNRYDDAHAHLQRALELFGQLGDHAGQAKTHGIICRVLELENRCDEALEQGLRCLDLYRTAGDRTHEAKALGAVGWCLTRAGRHEESLSYSRPALALMEALDDRYGQANVLDSLAHAHQGLHDVPRMVDCYRRAIQLFRALGDRYNEALVLTSLGNAFEAAGNLPAARDAWREALPIFDGLGHTEVEVLRAKVQTGA